MLFKTVEVNAPEKKDLWPEAFTGVIIEINVNSGSTSYTVQNAKGKTYLISRDKFKLL